MPTRALIELLGFQLVWISCALSAASGRTAPALVVCAVFSSGLIFLSERSVALAKVTFSCAAIGFTVETILIRLGTLTHVTTWPSAEFAPAWIVGLWGAFGAALPPTIRLLGSRAELKSVPAGALFGPMAYLAGSRIEALKVVEPALASFAVIVVAWGAALPLLVAVERLLYSERGESRIS